MKVGTITRKEPYEAINGRNGCFAAPIIYLISGMLVLPPTACLALTFVLHESIAAWGDLIVIGVITLWPVTIGIAAWAYVRGKQADSKRGPSEVSYITQDGGLASVLGQLAPQGPKVKVEKPAPKALPLGQVPWRIENSQTRVGSITKK